MDDDDSGTSINHFGQKSIRSMIVRRYENKEKKGHQSSLQTCSTTTTTTDLSKERVLSRTSEPSVILGKKGDSYKYHPSERETLTIYISGIHKRERERERERDTIAVT